MIRYALVCEAGHAFESWFPSSESYDDQIARSLVACPACGSTAIAKSMMSPRIGRNAPDAAADKEASEASGQESGTETGTGTGAATPSPITLTTEPEQRMRALLRAMREHITRTATHVGTDFPEEARRMHYGETAHRPIYGEASLDEARALVEEGIAVEPLPMTPDDRN